METNDSTSTTQSFFVGFSLYIINPSNKEKRIPLMFKVGKKIELSSLPARNVLIKLQVAKITPIAELENKFFLAMLTGPFFINRKKRMETIKQKMKAVNINVFV